jgi:hypothetical protein
MATNSIPTHDGETGPQSAAARPSAPGPAVRRSATAGVAA